MRVELLRGLYLDLHIEMVQSTVKLQLSAELCAELHYLGFQKLEVLLDSLHTFFFIRQQQYPVYIVVLYRGYVFQRYDCGKLCLLDSAKPNIFLEFHQATIK